MDMTGLGHRVMMSREASSDHRTQAVQKRVKACTPPRFATFMRAARAAPQRYTASPKVWVPHSSLSRVRMVVAPRIGIKQERGVTTPIAPQSL
jgi:hypothetical protein